MQCALLLLFLITLIQLQYPVYSENVNKIFLTTKAIVQNTQSNAIKQGHLSYQPNMHGKTQIKGTV